MITAITWTYALGSVIIVSLVSLVGVFVLGMHKAILERFVFFLVAISVGALFGDVFIHLLPEIFETNASMLVISLYILFGILIFFALEKFLRWHHRHTDAHPCEGEECQEQVEPVGYLILISDGVHNIIDGIIIGASYVVSIPLGIASTIAIFLHEVPQEIGDFGVLIHAGFSKTRALLYNLLSGLLAVVGVVAALLIGSRIESATPAIIAVAAGGFVYIAGSDLVPELQKTTKISDGIIQLVAISIGIALMVLLTLVE